MTLTSTSTLINFTLAIFIISFVSLTSCAPTQGVAPHHRSKRNIFQMCKLIESHTNRSCWDYNGYGCFCGRGNAKSRHVDGVDGCCKTHDRCYGEVSCLYESLFVGYSLATDNGTVTCADSPTFAPCNYSSCQCDLQLAQCLGRAKYHEWFKGFDRNQCSIRPRTLRRRGRNKRRRRKEKLKIKRQKLKLKERRKRKKTKTSERMKKKKKHNKKNKSWTSWLNPWARSGFNSV